MRPVVIYHADCPDGMTGGWAAWKKFGSRAAYLPMRHQNPVPSEVRNRVVYIVDFSYPVPLMRSLVKLAKRVIAIDHHRMALPSAKLAHETIFDNDHSGAVLAWKYFHPGKPMPKLVKHVEDIDLWRFKLRGTKEALAALQLVPHEFKAWDRFINRFENSDERKKLLTKGKAMLEYEEAIIKRILTKAVKVRWDGKIYYAVNSPVFASDLAHELSKKSKTGVGIVWHRSYDGFKVSLRSHGSIDTVHLAARYGGGGHKNASGFRIKKGEELPWKIIT